MESSNKSIPSEKPTQNKKSPPKKKKKTPPKASQSSNKDGSNSNPSAGKSSRHSDHNDRRERYHYNRHSNQKDKRVRSHYNNSNYDSERNFSKRPSYKGWSSSGGSSYGNRVWKRPNSSHSNDRFQNYNNFQREGGCDYYNNQQSRHSSDTFRNFRFLDNGPFQKNTDNLLESSENRNFWQDNIVEQFPVPEALASVIQFADEILKRQGRSDLREGEPGNKNPEVAFTPIEFLTNQNNEFKTYEPGTIVTNQNQELPPADQIEQINANCPLPELINKDLELESLINSKQNPDQIEQLNAYYQQGVLTNQDQGVAFDHQLEQLKEYNPPESSENPEDIFANIKAELQESEFNLEECINSNNSFPSISVIPISRLIKSEIQDLNRSDIIAPTTPIKGKPSPKPNLVQRKKSISKDGTLSENIVQRVANMDKVGIKNVINSSGTKYDAALKIQARKKLREEIRKQLKSMNFTPTEDNGNNVLIPDEIVDSMSIPAVVLDEIRKAFGIVLVEDKNTKISDGDEKSFCPPAIAEEPAKQTTEGSPKSPDLMSRLKMLEECKSHSEKTPQIKLEKSRRSESTEPIVIIDSSSSSSSGSSSSSDSDSSSTSSGSNCSNSSSFKRRRRKKRILEANVVGNFEKLILPNLTVAQRRRYKEKYSKTTKNSLLYIYGVCVSRANRNNSSADEKEQQKVKQNLSSADNAQALEFLMKAILSLFEKQKESLKKSKAKKTLTEKPQIKSPNPVSATLNKLKDSACNQRNSDDDKVSSRERSESANSDELPKHQSTNKLDKASTSTSNEGRVTKKHDDSIAESANSAKRLSSNDGAPVALEFESDTESASGKNPPSRLWKSPGEKKCIEIESTSQLSSLGTLKPPFEMETPISSLGMMQSPLAKYPFDVESLKPQSSIGDEAVSSIREIDVKLMELHKRKMYIEEMILKLQKDKMEVDLWTMKLQNEKFILLNSALASVSASSSASKTAVSEKIKLLSKPFLDKIKNQKKIILRDASEEDTDDAIKSIANLRPTKRKLISSNKEENSKETAAPKRTRSAKKSQILDSCDEVSSKNESNSDQATNKSKKIEEEDQEDIKTVEIPQVDYTNVPNGNLEGWKLPITQIIVIGEAIVAASEDGNIYKFNIRSRVLESKFSKHTEAITQIFTCPKENFVYTTSLDGFLKKTSIENFGLELHSLNLQEPLQSIDIEWSTAFIGSRWGNIFTYDIKNNSLSESLLCSSGSSIIAIKATKEGPRKILIVSSKGNQINFRDAITGLLLRSLDVPDNLHIYSILLDDSCVYCGTQRNEIHQYSFTTGARLAIFNCGNGAVSMKLYKDKYIFVGCYDGFVYVLDKITGCQIGRFPGSGKMILALEIAGDKLITSAKDNSMQIVDIPKYIATIKDKS